MFGMSKKRGRRSIARSDQGDSGRSFNYYSNRAQKDQASPRNTRTLIHDAKSTKGILRNVPTIIAVSAILACIIYTFILDSNPKIIQINSSGAVFLQDIHSYEVAAHNLFKETLLNSNKITVNVNGITKKIEEQFPELEKVSITIPVISHRPIVYLTASRPILILNSSNGNYIINNRGIALLPTHKAAESYKKGLVTLKDPSDIIVKLGKTVIPAQYVSFITEVEYQLEAAKIPIEEFELTDRHGEIHLKLQGKSYYIKMNLAGDAREQTGATIALLRTKPSIKQYIDVRVSGRAYYR